MIKTHFAPYGSYKTRCGLTREQVRADTIDAVTELRAQTTCGDCQAKMTDLGDFPEVVE